MTNIGTEKVATGAGNFVTNVSSIQSQYFTEKGINDLRINYSIDEAHLPVLI